PFHQGVHTHYTASENLLQRAASHLRPGGELRLVANAFLKYPPLIAAHLGRCETLPSADGFRIYRARGTSCSTCTTRRAWANSRPSWGSSLRRAPCSPGMRQHTWSTDHGACDLRGSIGSRRPV